MQLLTFHQREQMLVNARSRRANPNHDPLPVVKIFTPDGAATWLLSELDPEDEDRAFGLCDLGLGCPELGWVSLRELASVTGQLGLQVERDLAFEPKRSLNAYARQAAVAGVIIA